MSIPSDYFNYQKHSDQISDELVEKNKNVTTRESWSCKFCGKVENKVVDFATHLLEHYNCKMRKTCETCGDSFLRTKVKMNVKVYTGRSKMFKTLFLSYSSILLLTSRTHNMNPRLITFAIKILYLEYPI